MGWQKAVSSGENFVSSPVAMHLRLSKLETLPNAQHDPHADWSLTLPITVHFGQLVAESNSAGISSLVGTNSTTSGSSYCSSPGKKAPKYGTTSSTVANLAGACAVQPWLPELMVSAISSKL